MIRRALLFSLLLLTAGCLGFGDQGDDVDPSSDDELEDEDEQDTEDENGTAGANREWSQETYEGTITGTPFFTPTPPSESQSFSFNVAQDVQDLVINLTTEGGELTMYVADPDCVPGPDATCEEQVPTEGGEAQYANETAAPGEWNVRFFAQDTVANGVGYEAVVAQLHLEEAS